MLRNSARAVAAIFAASLAVSTARCGELPGDRPLMSMRLRANECDTHETWTATFKAIAANPGCCDEIWFSTGVGAPPLEWHRQRAEILAKAVKDVKAAGIAPSLQFQATIGHGDSFVTAEMCAMKTWTGWTESIS